ncbi:uncharacterized protein M421DRAFT_232381 [Didymella exigua CBS 183.55]|uniref:Uncharacterized protein n=1 Tax=Didymella exigua CBS 183.55 TaxID=1150837 RepID=A0A6A5RC51_9PLEO|nr:uncharacterized protein M421DRAFT_232381 [Didymella exigua CBS 183.55]KAF1925821.1 hypothetical protein M421DRAFT_232381 [Didymella exigua CBS 183.55]
MSVHDPFPDFVPALPTPSTPVITNEILHRTFIPTASDVPRHEAPFNTPSIQHQTRPKLTTMLRAYAGLSIAVLTCMLGLATAIEDSTCLPQLTELGNGLIGLVCAGGIVMGVVILDHVSDAVDTGIEAAWGEVWRRIKDCVAGGRGEHEGNEMEEVMMFNEEGNTVFLHESPPGTPKEEIQGVAEPVTPRDSFEPCEEGGNGTLGLLAFTLPPLPQTRAMNSPPSPPRQEFAYTSSSSQSPFYHPVPHQRVGHGIPGFLHSQTYADENHTSGLLGPSPMPQRRTDPGWQHFTGRGFDRHRQKLEAVSEWSHPGTRARKFDDILEEIEEMAGQEPREILVT